MTQLPPNQPLRSQPPLGQPSVSVALATFNGARFLRSQLDSLANQTCLPAELVITDDGSTDATEQVVADFAASAPFPVRWAGSNDPKLGHKANFMRAASLCTSDLISFCDQDDFWHPSKLMRAVEAFADPAVALFTHSAYLVDEDGQTVGMLRKPIEPPQRTPAGQAPPWLYWHGFVMTFRRRLLDFTDAWQTPLHAEKPASRDEHDVWFGFLASILGDQVYCANPLSDYRQHGTNVFGQKDEKPTFAKRMRSRLEDRRHVYVQLAKDAERRSSILGTLAAGPVATPLEAGAFAAASAAYATLARLYQRRSDLYCGGLVARFAAMSSLIGSHAYDTGGAWTFGRKAIVKDAVLGLAFAPLTARYGIRGADGDPTCRATAAASTRRE